MSERSLTAMDASMEDTELPEDYLSPRSKVAKMLADIDDAPTPSPSQSEHGLVGPAKTGGASLPGSLRISRSGSPSPFGAKRHSPQSSIHEDEEEDAAVIRPVGRIARRMLMDDDSIDEMYSATPVKKHRSSHHSSPARQSSATPQQHSFHGAGLFVSPAKSVSESDDDLPSLALGRSSRFDELVATKRAERLVREDLERRQRSEAAASSDLPEDIVETADGHSMNPELDKILSDAARPTRKASKKAMLEMERETQRLAREQALTHQMKTKKKFTSTDLFARFNFRQQPVQESTNSTSSSAPNSDAADDQERVHREPVSTPPSSPPTPWDTQKALVDRGALARLVPVREDSITSLSAMPISDGEDDDLPGIEQLMRGSRSAKATVKGSAPTSPSRTNASRMRLKLRQLQAHDDSGDDELDIVQPMPEHLRVFDRVKPVSKKGEMHSKAIHALKHLAHLSHDNATARGKKTLKPVVPLSALNAQLIATAKAQARKAQQERLAVLQAKGVVILSAEEQEREHDQFENLLEKARQEAQEIRKKEKAARRANGEADAIVSDDEDEDADWVESGDEEALEELEGQSDRGDVIDDAAEDDEDEDEEDEVAEDTDALPEEPLPNLESMDELDNAAVPKAVRKTRVVHDEDDEDDPVPDASSDAPTQSEDPFAAFGFDTAAGGLKLMSPTQAFAATMQTPSQLTQAGTGSSRFSALHYEERPRPTFGQISSQADLDDSQNQMIPASQVHDETQVVSLGWETQMPETPLPESKKHNDVLDTPGWEPSQDAGLPSPWTVARQGEAYHTPRDEHETQSTVALRISESPQPHVPRHRGRLTRGPRLIDSDDEEAPVAVPKKHNKNAFAEMQRLRLDSMNNADRAAAEREMKDMMDDQAEESEDEYAGLGGDDSNNIAPETEEDRAMFDESLIEIDEQEEREMQKFYAERQRAAEEEATSKLYKDLTTGALRRRQGVGWELDEDEDDLAARRRQIKQREEARKRRLLLQDDNVKGLLEGKGDSKAREAFLRTIGDDDDDDQEEDFTQLEHPEEEEQDEEAGQQDSQPMDKEPLREISNNKRRSDASQDLPPAKARRVNDDAAFSRPTSMLQVRESLSFLLDEPAHASFASTPSDDGEEDAQSDSDEEDLTEAEVSRDNDGGYAPDQIHAHSLDMPPPPLPTDRLPASQRRTAAKPAVIDRLSLRRGSSSSSSTSSLGWSAWSTSAGNASKVPSLLRRATSNLSAASTNDRGVSYNNANANERGVSVGGARTGGSNKSSLAYQSRAQERKAVGERAEKKKDENRRKMAEIRRQQGGALASGGFDGGRWE